MKRDHVVCIGNATLDRAFALTVEPRAGTKNPAIARPVAFGGVARNVAENLARLGVRASLVASLGDDDAGRAILADCAGLGIDTGRCIVTSAYPTPQYAALLDSHNDLIIGASDMRAIESLASADVLAAAEDDVAWTLADCNLAESTLAALIAAPRASGHHLAIDAVSVAKAERLPVALHGVGLLFCNVAEARAILRAPEDEPEPLAQALAARGAESTILTLGAAGALVAGAGRLDRVPAVPAQVADATGAGDGLIAGTIAALIAGAPLLDALRTGTIVAALALESESPVNPRLTAALVEARRP